VLDVSDCWKIVDKVICGLKCGIWDIICEFGFKKYCRWCNSNSDLKWKRYECFDWISNRWLYLNILIFMYKS
jgi:hypothetical protein